VSCAAMLVVGLGTCLAVSTTATDAREPARTASEAAARPNIILITTDDQTLADMRWLPRTRRLLGRHGVTFEQMLSPHPLCCPARAEIITGQYAQNNGVHSNAGPYGGLGSLKRPSNTLAAWLQDAGYRTALIGKYLNGYKAETDGVPNGWDHWHAAAHNGFGYYGFRMSRNGQLESHPPDGIYSTDLVTQDTTSQIRTAAQDPEQPFFIWSSYYAPHGSCRGKGGEGCDAPAIPARRHRTVHRSAKAPSLEKPSFNEADLSDKPRFVRHLTKVSPRYTQRLFTRRIQALAAVDEGVAAIVDALSEVDELDQTVVMFTSDNGYLLGEHRYDGKNLAYEESLRVPLLMRGPGLPEGAVRKQPVTTVDLAATVVSMSGAVPKRVLDGRDIVPVAMGRAQQGERTVLIQAGPPGHWRRGRWLYRGVRTNRYTFVRWTVDGHFLELYDRRRDPYQLRNVARDPSYAEIRRELLRRTKVLSGCRGPGCRASFDPLPRPSSNRVDVPSSKYDGSEH
jgi:N-acetylglucosamine-6-sulfatase